VIRAYIEAGYSGTEVDLYSLIDWLQAGPQRLWVWIMDKVPEELTAILSEIEKALAAKLYYLAIAVALSVPDICACLECDHDKPIWATPDKYVAWCDANIGPSFKNLVGVDLFRIRGGVLHQGHFDHPKSIFDRVMFVGPESSIKMHDVIVTVMPGVAFGGRSAEELKLSGKLLQLDVLKFCNVIIDAARKWSIAKSTDTNVQRICQTWSDPANGRTSEK
jgi:hypothetical protein